MRLLLDTHVLLAVLRDDVMTSYRQFGAYWMDSKTPCLVSAVSLWEIAIKTRLGKLNPYIPLEKIEAYIDELNLEIVPITAAHALEELDPLPSTRDPFDRLLLAQCQIEGMQLATVDRALSLHPLSLKT
jgi:PIN domain nuclease of toxin-antitoxin system